MFCCVVSFVCGLLIVVFCVFRVCDRTLFDSCINTVKVLVFHIDKLCGIWRLLPPLGPLRRNVE